MKVKRLELQGFKSFKDKTVIHFDHTITGIVGPNGCGKSNIVDAFFWVMGEQSYKHMRGSSSSDLIFNGSSKYSPLGYAEATLVLEKQEVDTEREPAGASVADEPVHFKKKEVAVTRRVYRGGEGEYYIGGVQCRLKDVKELFMDTGVGTKGYSVIEQGQVAKIINSKPEDRRHLIEEAAGIAKYKARKTESIRKMETARVNLERLNDVIKEIERSLASLDRQAQKARRHKELKEQLQSEEMEWGHRKYRSFHRRLDALTVEKESAEQDVVRLRSEISTADNQIEINRTSQLTDSKRTEELQQEIQELSATLAQEKSALELSKRRQDDLEQQISKMISEKNELISSLETDRSELTQQEADRSSREETLQLLSARLQKQQAEVQEEKEKTASFASELSEKREELFRAISSLSELNTKMAASKTRLDSLSSQSKKLEEKHQFVLVRADEIENDLHRCATAREDSQERHRTASESFQSLEKQRDQLKSDLERAQIAREDLVEEYTQAQTRLESLEELARTHEGLSEGPKYLLESSEGRFQIFADLIRVDEKFETAAEGYLSSMLEQVIAPGTRDALEALKKLALKYESHASVLIPSGDEISSEDSNVSSEAESSLEAIGFRVLGRLDQFIRFEGSERTQAFLKSRCQEAVVVETIEGLEDRLPHVRGVLVTLQGEVIEHFDHGMIVRGGKINTGSSASLVARRRLIDDLKEKSLEMEAAVSQQVQRVEGLKKEISRIELDVEGSRTEVKQLDVKLATEAREEESIRTRQAEIRSQLEELTTDQERIAIERDEVETSLETAEKEQVLNKAREDELEAFISERDSTVKEKNQVVVELEEKLQAIRIEEASLRERLLGMSREMESARTFIQGKERRAADLKAVLDRTHAEKDQYLGSEDGIESRISLINQDLGSKRDELSEVRDRLEVVTAEIQVAMDQSKNARESLDQKQVRANEAAVEVERILSDMDHLKQNMDEKYGVGCLEKELSPVQEEMNEPVVTREMTEQEEKELFERVEQLREKIRRMGEVNTMAIEEFEELKKRHEHLEAEQKDLVQSIADLEAAIEHINLTSKERFRVAFESIEERFRKLFPIVFGGGQAKLSLVYPEGSDDILEAGVDILAQPPGKKVVNITLLSGGEKALTAVALLFGIFMVKPSPFCVLDEVDAPLDDANIGRFNTLLREMSAKTQFILITHNKKTMQLNDCLYGVTMEEPGVSKMLSIEMQ